ncbi:MAG: tetratricopeptide repeat protein [Candidatus Coatesbacteria bacterium]|nr:MAG: tetratricopeptide repeat protein [Candidatus Coatesbacteria bacterium]
MGRIALISVLVVLTTVAAGCGGAGSQVTVKDLNDFAVRCSKSEMWGEAEFRLRNALALQADDARLHNNLAVALEAQAKLEEAYAEYKRAVALDPDNDEFRRNLDEFVNDHRWMLESNGEE